MSVIEIKVPVIGESITEVTLSQWLKEDGDYVALDELICEFESDKATLELPAEVAGKLIYVATEGDDLEIGAIVAKIDTSVAAPDGGDAPVSDAPKAEEKTPVTTDNAKENYATGHPSPSAEKLIKENNLAAGDIKGTGKDGRILKDDVLKAADAKKAAPAEKPASKAAAPVTPVISTASFSREVRREKMSRMRRTIAARLVEAKNETAMLTTFNEIDLTNVMALRKQYQERFVEKYGIKLGFMSLFTKACAMTLMEMPEVNAILDGNELIYHDFADISIAVSTPTGLVVPVVKNSESLKFHEIEYKIKELAGKARNGNLSLDEMKGGTFTITNGGVFGSLVSTPIINRPQSAILGMHTIKNRPVEVNGEIKLRPMMFLALSYDHRVIDGSNAVTFLVKVIKRLEDPTAMLLDI
ncbi:MAG: 2-oxoglutarate dehydrogenase complex dihydrolipoyllysine-residue succinyltransferase [Saprospiraceae bacterium]|nr:2-oxoglutarate dehydrogenase complex dihydrolipoyllysine-residue succinyltransferase [Saprospiraceae bacterium]